MDHNAAYHGVWGRCPQSVFAEFQASENVFFLYLHHTKIGYKKGLQTQPDLSCTYTGGVLCEKPETSEILPKNFDLLLKEIRHIFHRELDHQYGREEVEHFFYHFVEHYLGQPKFHLALHPNWVITKDEEAVFFRGLASLRQGQPLHYILGSKYFMDLKFRLNPHVLIPRPETEELVRKILEDYQDHTGPLEVLDLGTGSGCIAVALAKYLPRAGVHATDVSEEALRLAEENARENGVEVDFLISDIRSMELSPGVYDVIVSNPPYVMEEERKDMEPHVKDAEPALALFVPDDRPLLFYEYIAKQAYKALVNGGKLYLEINRRFGQEVKGLLEGHGFTAVEVSSDLHGKDRFVSGIKE
jgi:release factor glutamine methyltransferase